MGRGSVGRALSLLPFFALYVSFGTTFGLLTSGAPLILRVRGVELVQIGLLQAMNLPLGLTFLWATVVDRVRVPGGLPRRIGWIVLMQGGTVALLAGIAAAESAGLATLLALGMATCFCVATMDIALEALVVETVPAETRVLVSSAKFCGASLGGILGAGLLVGSYETLGWTGTVASVAGLDALCLLPLLGYPERRLRRPDVMISHATGRLGRLRALARHILVLGFYFAALYAISSSNGLALLDLGLSLGEVGLMTGTLSPAINLAMSLAAGLLVKRFGTVQVITVLSAGLLGAAGMMAVAASVGSARTAVVATVVGAVCASGLGVPVFNMLYRWAEGPRAATDYAVLFGAAFFASMPVRIGAPAIAGTAGWAGYFALAVPLYAAAFWLLRREIVRTLASEPSPERQGGTAFPAGSSGISASGSVR